MSSVSEIYTIAGAIEHAEKNLRLKNSWKSKNDIQKHFLENFLPVCRGNKIPEIELEISSEAEIINLFLAKKGFSIRFQPFPPNTIGFGSILNFIVEWLKSGEKVKIKAYNGKIYDGVRITKDNADNVSFFESLTNGYKYTVVSLRTRSGDLIFIAVPNGNLEFKGLDLIDLVNMISKNKVLINEYEGVRFPMVNLDITNNIDWIKGMSTLDSINNLAEITQAIQQIKIKINEKGAQFQTGTGIAVTIRGIVNDLIIKEPFLLWVERHNLDKPLLSAFIKEEDWKSPM